MNMAVFTGFQERKQKIRLRQGLSSGKGYPAGRRIIKNRVFFNLDHHLADGQFPSGHFAGLRKTDIRALSALQTFFRVCAEPGFHFLDGVLRTHCQAFAAADTPAEGIELFPANPLALGIVAPPAGKWTAFEKNSCPDSRTIMDGIFFYIKDDSAFHILYDI
jgi:hypothetical protein